MPYNPGQTYQGGALIEAGMREGVSKAAQTMMWLLDRAGKTKELRSYVKTAFPGQDTTKMGLEDLTGFVQGKAAEEQAQKSAMAQALQQAQLDQINQQAANDAAMSAAMREAGAAGSGPAVDMNILRPDLDPGAAAGNGMGGGPLVGNVSVPSAPPLGAASLFRAMTRHAGSEATPSGRSVIGELWREGNLNQADVMPVPWSAGGLRGVVSRRTGKLEVFKEAKPGPLDNPPGAGPTLSGDKKFYWDRHLQSWKPLPGKHGTSLFDEEAGGGYKTTDDVSAAYKAGKISWDDAAGILRDQFGVK